jgi:hypothetical protein
VATTTTPRTGTDEVIEAMREIHTESDRWHLAEALHHRIPQGLKGFQEILDKANSEGVAGGLSVNTLRLYRDTAGRWPADKRVAEVSFSAHREVMALPNSSVDAQAKLLRDLVRSQGVGKVTVASVRKAVQVKSGKTPASRGKSQPAAGAATTQAAVQMVNILDDIMSGSPKLIAMIGATTSGSELNKLESGLNKAIAHVQALKMKAARKQASAKKVAAASQKVTPISTAKPETGATKVKAIKRGLRGL